MSGWTDIVAIDASDNCTAGLKADGTVVTTILPFDEKNSDTVAVAFPNTHSLDLVCLKADGSVVTTSDSLAPALSKGAISRQSNAGTTCASASHPTAGYWPPPPNCKIS